MAAAPATGFNRARAKSLTPLTHHDIVKASAPLVRRGWQVDMRRTHRESRHIQFTPDTSRMQDVQVMYSLLLGEQRPTKVERLLKHVGGAVSCLGVVVDDIEAGVDALDQIELERQMHLGDDSVIACSYRLAPHDDRRSVSLALQLRFVCAHIRGLEMRVDVSPSAGMPADVRLKRVDSDAPYLSNLLADGLDSPLLHPAIRSLAPDESLAREAGPTPHRDSHIQSLPDDVLAVLGSQWRPLVHQGDHWKGVLRRIDREPGRTGKALDYINEASAHLERTLSSPPRHYHEQHAVSRWRVFGRRLQPLMLLVGILCLVPIAWLLTSGGEVALPPPVLGLTPVLLIGLMALTVREVPVMELPPMPRALPESSWTADT